MKNIICDIDGVLLHNNSLIGDNMRTDILAGVQAGIETILVLSGITKREELDLFPYHPSHIFERAGEITIDQI